MSDARETAAEARLRQLARERHLADADFRRAVRWTAALIALACLSFAALVWSVS